MAARLLLHPFTVTALGGVATAEQGSDTYIDSQIAVVIGTRLGERDMCVPYGVPDPAYATLSAADIQTCLDRFGPDDATVTSVKITTKSDLVDVADVRWRRGSAR